jgi:hypothetical protein
MMWILKNKLPLNIMNLRHKVINHKNSTMDTIARELTPMFHHPEKKLQAKHNSLNCDRRNHLSLDNKNKNCARCLF